MIERHIPALAMASILFACAGSAHAVCMDYGNYKPTNGVVGGVAFAEYKQDKIEAYFYGNMCWTTSEIAEEGNRRIFYKLIATRDANGHIASYVPLADSAPTMFTCPKGSTQSRADGHFDQIDGAKPGFHSFVCKAVDSQ
ncbi:hypothetical protein LG201_07985 [Methylobacillus gramineus]|uniref:hypothetical protein n=1 Tax=Methylobacillus gramineus TaxID=755169 RepID=UPI001CFFE9AC|nr:hypothetical protein [Methylobacillus gramineus]MCB5185142.1 hypothetical protein [Methylobacillus gramineus]